jgi:hypothetical protein
MGILTVNENLAGRTIAIKKSHQPTLPILLVNRMREFYRNIEFTPLLCLILIILCMPLVVWMRLLLRRLGWWT